MRKEIAAITLSAVALVTLAARAQAGAIDPNRSHNEHDYPPSVAAATYGAAGEHEHDGKQKYTCPMHPEVVMDHPGNCPKCGMKLVPLKREERRMSNAQRPTSNSEHMMHHGHDMAMPHHDHGGHEMHPPSHEIHEMHMEMHSSV